MTRRISGTTIRDYDEHADYSRKVLFARDREIRRAEHRAAKAEDALEFIEWVIRDEGTRDPAWTIDRIRESLETVGIPKGSAA